MSAAPELAACPKCRSTNLALWETHEECGESWGPVVVVDGHLFNTSAFYFRAGDPLRAVLFCQDCRHEWRSRRPVGGSHSCTRCGEFLVDSMGMPVAECVRCATKKNVRIIQ